MQRKQKKRSSEERAIQVQIVYWCKWNNIPVEASQNGANLEKKKDRYGNWYCPQAIKLKEEGMIPGTSDIKLYLKGGIIVSIEIKIPETKKYVKSKITGNIGVQKRAAGKQSAKQAWMQEILTENGHDYSIAYSLDDFQKIVAHYKELGLIFYVPKEWWENF